MVHLTSSTVSYTYERTGRMSYKSMKSIASAAGGALIVAAYLVFALGASAPDSLQGWAVAMLIFIAGGVVLLIVIQILFYILATIGIAVKERVSDEKKIERILASSMLEDERDKQIMMRSTNIGSICASAGLVVALATLAFGASAVVALHVLLAAAVLGTIVAAVVRVYLYEVGIQRA